MDRCEAYMCEYRQDCHANPEYCVLKEDKMKDQTKKELPPRMSDRILKEMRDIR
jgi:hypothetical protein